MDQLPKLSPTSWLALQSLRVQLMRSAGLADGGIEEVDDQRDIELLSVVPMERLLI